MTDFDDYQAELSPSWLRGPFGILWSRILGLGKAGVVAAAKEAVKQRFAATAAPDALLELAADRALDVGFLETAASLRSRVYDAWETWMWAGTRKSMVDAFASVGLANIEITESTTSPILGWWQFDLTVHPPFPWEGPSPENVPENYRALFKALVRKWKPTHAECRRLQVNCYAETWAQRQARRVTWDAPPPEPWTGKILVIQEGIL